MGNSGKSYGDRQFSVRNINFQIYWFRICYSYDPPSFYFILDLVRKLTTGVCWQQSVSRSRKE